MIGPYILLGAVILSFIAIFLYLGISRYKGKRTWLFPRGQRTTNQYGSFTAHFIVTDTLPPFPPADLAKRAALAAHCLYLVKEKGNAVPSEFVVHLVGDETYNKNYDERYNRNSHGMLLSVERQAGSDAMPMVVCRASSFGSTPLTGSLVIHELTHYCFPYAEDHEEDKVIWIDLAVMEDKAQAEFKKLLLTMNAAVKYVRPA